MNNNNQRPNTPEEIIELVRAYDGGESFEARAIPEGVWVDISTADHPLEEWNFNVLRYRIKRPSPRVFWINVYPDNGTVDDILYQSKSEADDAAESDRVECIKLVEYATRDEA